MKKISVLFAAFSCTMAALPLCAQLKKPGLFIGGNFLYNSPSGSFGDNYKSGPGVEINGGVGLGKIFIVASYGSSRFLSKPDVKDIIIKPLKIGVKQFVLAKNIFIAADAGSVKVRNKTTGIEKSEFIGDIGGGIRLAGLEAGIYYNSWKENNNSFGFMQYKIGYSILL